MRPTLRSLVAFLVASLLLWPGAIAAQDASPEASPIASPMASPVASPGASPVAGEATNGVLLANMDPSTDPGEDFFRYATGGWQDRTEIPADEARLRHQFRRRRRPHHRATPRPARSSRDLGRACRSAPTSGRRSSSSPRRWTSETRNAQGHRADRGRPGRNRRHLDPRRVLRLRARRRPDHQHLRALRYLRRCRPRRQLGLHRLVLRPGPRSAQPRLLLGRRREQRGDPRGLPSHRRRAPRLRRATTPPAARPPPRRSTSWRSGWPNRSSAPRTTTTPATTTTRRPIADLIAANPDFDWPGFLEILGHPRSGNRRRHRDEVPGRGRRDRRRHRPGDAQGLSSSSRCSGAPPAR